MLYHQLQVLYCLNYILLAIFEETPPLVAGRQIIVGDDIIYPVQHPPLILFHWGLM